MFSFLAAAGKQSPYLVQLVNQPVPPWYVQFFPTFLAASVSIFAVWAVHRLTKSRERERAIFRLYAVVSEMTEKACDVAIERWSTKNRDKREILIAETTWRIHQVATVVEQLRQLSQIWRFADITTGKLILKCPIDMGGQIIMLRQSITGDPFSDPGSGTDSARAILAEQAKGKFLTDLSEAVGHWERGIECS